MEQICIESLSGSLKLTSDGRIQMSKGSQYVSIKLTKEQIIKIKQFMEQLK